MLDLHRYWLNTIQYQYLQYLFNINTEYEYPVPDIDWDLYSQLRSDLSLVVSHKSLNQYVVLGIHIEYWYSTGIESVGTE